MDISTHSTTNRTLIIFVWCPGVTRIGREDAPTPQDITIQGPGVEAEHCLIINDGWCLCTLCDQWVIFQKEKYIEGLQTFTPFLLINTTGGVVTLDPCGHLCSLDGVQVTVPTPLTQGENVSHTHTHTGPTHQIVFLYVLRDTATYWLIAAESSSNLTLLLSVHTFSIS